MPVAPMKTLAVLGSTGSIGTNTLDVVRRNRHLYQVYSLAAGQNVATSARESPIGGGARREQEGL